MLNIERVRQQFGGSPECNGGADPDSQNGCPSRSVKGVMSLVIIVSSE